MILDHITGNVIADLGTDHAYIPIELAKKGGFQGMIATDVRPGPLAAARAGHRSGKPGSSSAYRRKGDLRSDSFACRRIRCDCRAAS